MTACETTISKLYSSLEKGDSIRMCECYHPNIQFSDPVFGIIQGNAVCLMWEMLIEKSNGKLQIEFFDVKADDYLGSASLKVSYSFGKKHRKVVNSIYSNFHFKDGLIIKQTDDFDIWKWSKQAFGIRGMLFGWTGFFQNKIQKQALNSLQQFTSKCKD